MQTAVEWFDQKLQEFAGFQSWSPDKSVVIKLIIPVSEYDNLKEQAKQIEKQQIIDAFTKGADDGYDGIYDSNKEQYYNETYGSKGSENHIVDTNEMISSQTEISDEEIEKAFTVGYGFQKTVYTDRIEGAKWYREQLKSRQ